MTDLSITLWQSREYCLAKRKRLEQLCGFLVDPFLSFSLFPASWRDFFNEILDQRGNITLRHAKKAARRETSADK